MAKTSTGSSKVAALDKSKVKVKTPTPQKAPPGKFKPAVPGMKNGGVVKGKSALAALPVPNSMGTNMTAATTPGMKKGGIVKGKKC